MPTKPSGSVFFEIYVVKTIPMPSNALAHHAIARYSPSAFVPKHSSCNVRKNQETPTLQNRPSRELSGKNKKCPEMSGKKSKHAFRQEISRNSPSML